MACRCQWRGEAARALLERTAGCAPGGRSWPTCRPPATAQRSRTRSSWKGGHAVTSPTATPSASARATGRAQPAGPPSEGHLSVGDGGTEAAASESPRCVSQIRQLPLPCLFLLPHVCALLSFWRYANSPISLNFRQLEFPESRSVSISRYRLLRERPTPKRDLHPTSSAAFLIAVARPL